MKILHPFFLVALTACGGALTVMNAEVDNEALQKNLEVIRLRRELAEPSSLSWNASARAEKEKEVMEAEKETPKIPSDEILKLLREKGFGITGGYGQLTRTDTRMASLQLRYNLLKSDVAGYNNRVYKAEPDKQIRDGGRDKLYQFANTSATRGDELNDMSDLHLPAKILSGVYLWGGWTSAEVTFGTEKAKPLLAGLGVGFGPLEKGASTVHVDVGLAFYGNSKMPKDDIYVGLSVDLELFKKLVTAF